MEVVILQARTPIVTAWLRTIRNGQSRKEGSTQTAVDHHPPEELRSQMKMKETLPMPAEIETQHLPAWEQVVGLCSTSLPLHMQKQENGKPQNPPRSFSSNFLRANGGASRGEGQGHKRLSSSASHNFSKPPQDVKPRAGINYEYFSGNTVFFLGGRLQNTRDRPVNIISGLIVLVPSILFLVFS